EQLHGPHAVLQRHGGALRQVALHAAGDLAQLVRVERSRAVERLEPAAEAAGPAGPAGNRDPRRASEAALGPDRAARADDARLAHGGADQRGQQLCLPPVLVTEGERLELVDALGVEPAGGADLLRVAERAD